MSSSIPYRGAPDRPNEQFTMIGHDNTRNTGQVPLSGLAMALHHYLLSLPPGWRIDGIDDIADKVFPLDSRERVRRANRELMNAGLVILHTGRDDSGRFTKWYQVFHSPQPEDARTPSSGKVPQRRKVEQPKPRRESPQVTPDAGKPDAGKPAAGKPAAGFPADKQKTEQKTEQKTKPSLSGASLADMLADAAPDADEREIEAAVDKLAYMKAHGEIETTERAYLRGIIARGDAAEFIAACRPSRPVRYTDADYHAGWGPPQRSQLTVPIADLCPRCGGPSCGSRCRTLGDFADADHGEDTAP